LGFSPPKIWALSNNYKQTGLTQLAQIGLGAAAPHLDISYVAMLKR
jgi:hypothetical protein